MSLIEKVGGIQAARRIAHGVPDDTATHIIDYADNGVIDYLKNDNGWQSHYSGGWNSVHSIISAHFNDDCLIKISDLRAAIASHDAARSDEQLDECRSTFENRPLAKNYSYWEVWEACWIDRQQVIDRLIAENEKLQEKIDGALNTLWNSDHVGRASNILKETSHD